MSLTAVLLSGGVDSTACAAFYLGSGHTLAALFVDYGQAARQQEEKAARAISRFFRIPLGVVRCRGLRSDIPGITRGRNLALLSMGLSAFADDAGIIALGVHLGSAYPDCGANFIAQVQRIFDLYTQGSVQVGVPFLEWTKTDIWAFCKREGVPVQLTYSCELGLRQPCGHCRSCRDLEVLSATSH